MIYGRFKPANKQFHSAMSLSPIQHPQSDVGLMQQFVHNVEVTPRKMEGLTDVRGEVIRRRLQSEHNLVVTDVRSIVGYHIKTELTEEELEPSLEQLFTDPIIEQGTINSHLLDHKDIFEKTPDCAIQVGFKPGVTDNSGSAALDGFKTLFPNKTTNPQISTSITYIFYGISSDTDLNWLASQLHNNLIERVEISDYNDCAMGEWPLLPYPEKPMIELTSPESVNLNVSDQELIQISETGLLALNLNEMKTIQRYYQEKEVQEIRKIHNLPPSMPTDVELECLAQTWSEHCKHKIFAAKINHIDTITGEKSTIDSLFKTHIMQPTLEMQTEVDWLLSVFHDNSGVISWEDDWSLCMKVETHNSPSALDPYGGAMTGIVGVNRDILGTGLGAKPIANTDVFCFGPPDWEGHIPENLFHPSRVLRGVHAGVRVGGNESGIPTVNGAMYFDERYLGKPLVYCGTVGIMPRKLKDGRDSHVKNPQPDDIVYMVGGRVGADGIHGATFSSLELTEESPSSAVQIGDPITQKKMLDMILEARDEGLITCITDNGAGGLSSSIGEMAEYTNGCEIDLSKVPLKQEGLSSWEILVSESQERMTVSVKKEDAKQFEELADLHEVEISPVASFTNSGMFHVKYGKETVALLPLEFLHDGVPQLELESEWKPPEHLTPNFPKYSSSKEGAIGRGELLEKLLSQPNIASKEYWVRQYDHEVIAQTTIKPFVGKDADAPGDAAVFAPIHGSKHGVVISCGMAPRYSDIDAAAMAFAAVDEAVRNAVCAGVNLDKIAGLDNFCWPDPIESKKTPDGKYKLAQLVRANRALEEICRGYNLPCISGKDSMKNDYGQGDSKISIPPTLLFSLIGDQPDVTFAQTSDFKAPNDSIYLIGITSQELGSSELAYLLAKSHQGGIGGNVPKIDIDTNIATYKALSNAIHAGLVNSAHDCSEGGLAVALAESCFGQMYGASIDFDQIDTGKEKLFPDEWGLLFGESLGRIIVSISKENEEAFQAVMWGSPLSRIGEVTYEPKLSMILREEPILEADIRELKQAWKSTLNLEREMNS